MTCISGIHASPKPHALSGDLRSRRKNTLADFIGSASRTSNLKQGIGVWLHSSPKSQTTTTLRESNPDLPSGSFVPRTADA
jgi:hypothetical protein